jgi:HK97 family phage prohead protease
MRQKRNRRTSKTITHQGFTVRVEYPTGAVIEGVDDAGMPFSTVYAADYGYFPKVRAVDGDDLDVFVGSQPDGPMAYVVDQLKGGTYDQPKVMLGYSSPAQAKDAFLSHRPGSMYGGMSQTPVESLRAQMQAWRDGDGSSHIELVAARVEGGAAEGPAVPVTQPAASAPTTEPIQENTMPGKIDEQKQLNALAMRVALRALALPDLDGDTRSSLANFVSRDIGSVSDVPSVSGGQNAADAGVTDRSDGMRVRDIRVRAVREAEREADFIASTDAVDSYGEVVRQNWILDRYNKNPVILFAHDSCVLAIGRSVRTVVEDGALMITVKFATAKANPMAEYCWQSVLEDMLRSGSVGFKPRKVTREDVGGVQRTVLDQNELYEFSLCPVPSNPEALRRMEERLNRSLLDTRSPASPAEPTPTAPAIATPATTATETTATETTATETAKDNGTTMKFKIRITDEQAQELRSRGAIVATCEGNEIEIDMPHVVKMEGDLGTARKQLEEFSTQVTTEKTLTAKANEERDAAVKSASDAKMALVRLTLDPFVGLGATQITPAMADEYAELSVAAPGLYEKHVASLRERNKAASPATTEATTAEAVPPTRAADLTPNTAGQPLPDDGHSGLMAMATKNAETAIASRTASR